MSLAAGPQWDVPMDEPLVMHAAALDLELDGDREGALDLLRAALALIPGDSMIAFDLARVAFEGDSERFDDDVQSFMAMEPENDDARMLRAYVLIRQGQRQAAREQLTTLIASSPELGEATRLSALVAGGDPSSSGRTVSVGMRVGVESDSNVTVVPDSPSKEEGLRIATSGSVTLIPARLPNELSATLAFRHAPHITRRGALSRFDVTSGTALVRMRKSIDDVLLTAQLSGNEVAIDSVGEQFMWDGFADVEVRYLASPVQFAAFGRGGYRDFTAFNPEKDPYDRDGWRTSAGLLADWSQGRLAAGVRASYEGADTDGRGQRERGAEAGAHLRWQAHRWYLQAGGNWALRRFAAVRGGRAREDTRLMASLAGSWSFDQHLGLFGSALWIGNSSNMEYDYERVLAQAGVFAQW